MFIIDTSKQCDNFVTSNIQTQFGPISHEDKIFYDIVTPCFSK